MAAQIGPNLNLNHSWTSGEDGWNTGMDENLIKLDTLQHLSVKSKSVATPPVSPTAGDRYIIASNPTGDWATFTNYITVYINNAWQMYTPNIGFVAYIEDLDVLNVYDSGWTDIHPAGDGNLHVPANSTINSGKVLTAGASAGLYTWEPASGGGLDWELVTINTTAVKDKGYLINATSNNVTILLPAAPVEGDSVGVCDVYNKADTNIITVDRNTNNIEGVAENLIVDINGAGFIFVYVDVTRGWEIISEIGTSSGIITNTITDGDLTHAPDGNSVFDALVLKAPLNSPSFTTPVLGTPTSGNLGNCTNAQMVFNLKPVVNAAVNKLDIFTKSGGAVPDSTNVVSVAIPDGNGYTFRSRAAAYLSGTSQFILADAANYWSKGSLDAEIKTAYIYAIWDGTGIIWALGGYSGFTRCPASTTVTDDDFFLLEESSTYTKAVTEYCVCVGKIRYQYDTADTPDHTIQTTVIDAPMVVWNPRSDYSGKIKLSSNITSSSDITNQSILSMVVKQAGKYLINVQLQGYLVTLYGLATCYIAVGSSTYASARTLIYSQSAIATYVSTLSGLITVNTTAISNLNVGDTIHLGGVIQVVGTANSGNRTIYSETTALNFIRID